MKNYLLGIATLAAVLSVPAPARPECALKPPADNVSSGKLTVGTSPVTLPQGFLEDDKPAGFAVELGEAIANEMCLKTQVINLPLVGLFGSQRHKARHHDFRHRHDAGTTAVVRLCSLLPGRREAGRAQGLQAPVQIGG